jgi:hypothetical protein
LNTSLLQEFFNILNNNKIFETKQNCKVIFLNTITERTDIDEFVIVARYGVSAAWFVGITDKSSFAWFMADFWKPD